MENKQKQENKEIPAFMYILGPIVLSAMVVVVVVFIGAILEHLG